MSYQSHQPCMKPRQDRSSPWKVASKAENVKPLRHGALGNDKQSFRGTAVSAESYAVLAAKGGIGVNLIHKAFNEGVLIPEDFKKAFWDEVDYSNINKKTAAVVNEFKHILF